MTTDYDIVISGAGPVGLSLAALLVKAGMRPERIGMVDGKTLDAAIADPRTLAMAWGSRQLLERLGAWPIANSPIGEIHVSRRGHWGRTLMTAAEFKLPELGYVCRYGALVDKLASVVSQSGTKVQRPLRVVAVQEDEDQVRVSLDDGLTLSCALFVQAEGGLFGEQPQRSKQRDYHQTAIIAHVGCSARHARRAWERFTDEGPLALLPEDDGYALVWCVTPDRAVALLALDDAAFLQALQAAFGERVGRFTRAGSRQSFPLGLNAHDGQTRRTVAIGNAAQTLHPVAGQGLNLGLRDAAELAQALVRGGMSPDAIQRFAARRRADRGLTIHLTDFLARSFASSPAGSPSQHLLSLGLGLMDAVPGAKRLLGEQMMFGRR